MESALTVAIITGIVAMFAWGIADYFTKLTVDRVHELTAVFWVQVVGVLFLLPYFVFRPEVSIPTTPVILYLIAFGLFEAISDVLMFKGFSKGQVSVLSPIFASYAGIAALISLVLFRESITITAQLGLIIIFSGVLWLSADPSTLFRVHKSKKITKGVKEVAGAALIYAVWLVFYDRVVGREGWIFYLLLVRSAEVVFLYIYAVINKYPLKLKLHKGTGKLIPFIALFDIAAYVAMTYGFSVSNHTSIIAVLGATFSVPTIILSRIFLKERVTPLQTIATLTVIIGVIIVVSA